MMPIMIGYVPEPRTEPFDPDFVRASGCCHEIYRDNSYLYHNVTGSEFCSYECAVESVIEEKIAEIKAMSKAEFCEKYDFEERIYE